MLFFRTMIQILAKVYEELKSMTAKKNNEKTTAGRSSKKIPLSKQILEMSGVSTMHEH